MKQHELPRCLEINVEKQSLEAMTHEATTAWQRRKSGKLAEFAELSLGPRLPLVIPSHLLLYVSCLKPLVHGSASNGLAETPHRYR